MCDTIISVRPSVWINRIASCLLAALSFLYMVGKLYMYIITSQRTLFTQSFFALEVEIGEKRECGKASKVELQQDHHRESKLCINIFLWYFWRDCFSYRVFDLIWIVRLVKKEIDWLTHSTHSTTHIWTLPRHGLLLVLPLRLRDIRWVPPPAVVAVGVGVVAAALTWKAIDG